MNILQLLVFILFASTINSQWYIKKTHHTKLMNYPNPGKRSVPNEQTNFVETDCLRPYSQLHSYRQKVVWIFTCAYRRSSLQTNENSLLSNSNNFDIGLRTTPTLIRHNNRSPHVASSYSAEHNNSYNMFLTKLLQGRMKDQ